MAAYFGCHSRIHAWIVTKIGRLRKDMRLDQNPEYLLISITDGLNIGYIQIRQGFFRSRTGRGPELKREGVEASY